MEATEFLTPHFSVAELACRCGCGRLEMDSVFLHHLEALRRAFAKPMPVTSGYRCARHNQNVSKTGASGPHTTGQAVDIAICGPPARRLLHLALSYGFSGIGVKQHGPHESRILHLDTVPRPFPVIWSYA